MQLENPLLIVEDDKGRREFILDAPIYLIGRNPTCDICLTSQFVSRHHATLVQFANDDDTYSYRIIDGTLMGRASNGLLINGDHLREHVLQHEDEIVFGSQVRAIYYLLKQNGDRPSSSDEASALVGSGGGDGGNPNDSEMASPDSWRY